LYKSKEQINEDKKYFPEMEEVYPGAETLVNEEDT